MPLCLWPQIIRSEEHDGSSASSFTRRVPCGRCAACYQNRRSEWTTRLRLEHRYSSSAWFVTLTYDEDSLPFSSEGAPTLVKKDVQDFIKRLRIRSSDNIRYYAVGEYGTQTLRPHYHLVIFNLSGSKSEVQERVASKWSFGLIHVGNVTPSSISYVAGYCLQLSHYPEGSLRPFSLMSRKPGIGAQFVERFADYYDGNTHSDVIFNESDRKPMPRYFRKKYKELDVLLYRAPFTDRFSSPDYDPRLELTRNLDYERRTLIKLVKSRKI